MEKSSNQVLLLKSDKTWQPLASQQQLNEGATIQTGFDGTLQLRLDEGTLLTVEPSSSIVLDTLHDTQNQPLILISLKQGKIDVQMAPYQTYRSVTIGTELAAVIVYEGSPTFAVRYDQGIATVGVKQGSVTIQPDNSDLSSTNVNEGEQVSFNSKKIGPIVAVGAPPSLEEPKELSYRIMELGHLEECEIPEGGKELCGSWSWNRKTQKFDAEWANGAKGELAVEKMNNGELVLLRRDLSGPTAGLTARYSGQNAGNEITGDVVQALLKGTVTWEYHQTTTKGTWQAKSDYMLDLGE